MRSYRMLFPYSEYILGQITSGLYNSCEYDQAENLYSDHVNMIKLKTYIWICYAMIPIV
jgi:hypothetical protein